MKLTIDRLGYLGDAIAAGPDGPIYVTHGLPGEEVEGDIQGDRMVAPKIITPSPDRVRAPCAHARSCGGCLLQHASDSFVAEWKLDVVRTALARQGLNADFLPILTSPPQSRRRASLTARRSKMGAMIGFHARGSDVLVPVPNCQLLSSELMAAFPALEALVVAGSSRKGEVQLTITQALVGPDVSVTGGKPIDATLRLELAHIAEKYNIARLSWENEVIALRTAPTQRFGAALVAPPAAGFLQATLQGEADLVAAVTHAVGGAKKIVDLFAGAGTFALPLAENAEVLAFEGEAEMVAALDKGWRMAQGLKLVTSQTRDLFRRPLEPDEFKGVGAVVIDPPRAGAEAQIATISRSEIPVVVAVSCNPVTFARDAAVLVKGGFELQWVQVIDQFRWSSHVELVAKFTKNIFKRPK
ncbi:MAG: class I SAM-dependent RNA methyltransferase [Paracoccaceae bacterium]